MMTDKERIEKFMLTMMHLDRCMDLLIKSTIDKEMIDGLNTVKKSIKAVIDANQDQIDIKLE